MGSTTQLVGGIARPKIRGHIYFVSDSNSPEPWTLGSIVLTRKNSCCCRKFLSHIHIVPKELREPSHRWSSHPDILPKHSSGRCQICSTTDGMATRTSSQMTLLLQNSCNLQDWTTCRNIRYLIFETISSISRKHVSLIEAVGLWEKSRRCQLEFLLAPRLTYLPTLELPQLWNGHWNWILSNGLCQNFMVQISLSDSFPESLEGFH